MESPSRESEHGMPREWCRREYVHGMSSVTSRGLIVQESVSKMGCQVMMGVPTEPYEKVRPGTPTPCFASRVLRRFANSSDPHELRRGSRLSRQMADPEASPEGPVGFHTRKVNKEVNDNRASFVDVAHLSLRLPRISGDVRREIRPLLMANIQGRGRLRYRFRRQT